MYDYLIVGAGIYGAVVARELTDGGKRVLVIDRRSVIGGNLHSRKEDGIEIHSHGPHVLHTESSRIWDYLKRFTEIEPYRQRTRIMHKGKLYSFPVNLLTLNQIFGTANPAQAIEFFSRMESENPRPRGASDLESWIVSKVGPILYRMFFEGYTCKQWGREPRLLPEGIIRRLPVRADANDEYFSHEFQGMPKNGYTPMFEKLLEGVEVRLDSDFSKNPLGWKSMAGNVIYGGSPDQLFDYDEGKLEYRTMRFQFERYSEPYQGCPTINHPDPDVPWVRTTEFRYFPPFPTVSHSTVLREFPSEYDGTNEPYYPINDDKNNRLAERYIERARAAGFVIGGRLGLYRYLDIHHVVAMAIKDAENVLRTSQQQSRTPKTF